MDLIACSMPNLDGGVLAKPIHKQTAQLEEEAAVKVDPARPRPLRYFWEDGIFKPKQELRDPSSFKELGRPFKEENLHGEMRDSQIGGVFIRFLIRSPTDPTGSNSPCVSADGDVLLCEVFNWCIANTYAHGPFLPPVETPVEDYCLMKVDMARRTLGKKYYYVQAQESALRVMDTEWWTREKFTKVLVVSSDRIPQGNYRPCESMAVVKKADAAGMDH